MESIQISNDKTYWFLHKEITGIPNIANQNSSFLTLQTLEFPKKIRPESSESKTESEFRIQWGSQKSGPKIGIPNQEADLTHAPARGTIKTALPYPNHLRDLAILHLGGALRTVASGWLPATVNPVAEASMLRRQTIECTVSPGGQSSGKRGLVLGYLALEMLCAQVKAHGASRQILKLLGET